MDYAEALRGCTEQGADPDVLYGAADEIERLHKILKKLQKVKFLYRVYGSGNSTKSYGQMIDDAMTPNAPMKGKPEIRTGRHHHTRLGQLNQQRREK